MHNKNGLKMQYKSGPKGQAVRWHTNVQKLNMLNFKNNFNPKQPAMPGCPAYKMGYQTLSL